MKLLNRLGLCFSLTGLVGVLAASFYISFTRLGIPESMIEGAIILLTGCSLPGLLLSGVSYRIKSNRIALWGTLLGLFGAAYLPTFLIPWLK